MGGGRSAHHFQQGVSGFDAGVFFGRDGAIVARFLSGTEPDDEDLLALLQKELNKK